MLYNKSITAIYNSNGENLVIYHDLFFFYCLVVNNDI